MNKKSVYFLVKLCLYFISHLFDLHMPEFLPLTDLRERERGGVCVCVWGGSSPVWLVVLTKTKEDDDDGVKNCEKNIVQISV